MREEEEEPEEIIPESTQIATPIGAVEIRFDRDPTIEEIKKLFISDPVLLETVVFLLTAHPKDQETWIPLSKLIETFQEFRCKYTMGGEPLLDQALRRMVFDLCNNQIFRFHLNLQRDICVTINANHATNIYRPFETCCTTQQCVTAAVRATKTRGEQPNDLLAQVFIYQMELLKAFGVNDDEILDSETEMTDSE